MEFLKGTLLSAAAGPADCTHSVLSPAWLLVISFPPRKITSLLLRNF